MIQVKAKVTYTCDMCGHTTTMEKESTDKDISFILPDGWFHSQKGELVCSTHIYKSEVLKEWRKKRALNCNCGTATATTLTALFEKLVDLMGEIKNETD